MAGDTHMLEFELDMGHDRTMFIYEFEKHFPCCESDYVSTINQAKPGFLHFRLYVPAERRDELAQFLEEYVENHIHNGCRQANSRLLRQCS